MTIFAVTAPDVFAIELSQDERHLLSRGLGEWGGPARPTDELARAMGFGSEEDLLHGAGRRLRDALDSAEPMSRPDWLRALLATEIVFASAVVGAGWDWSITTGFSDEETIKLLRAVQGKVAQVLRQA